MSSFLRCIATLRSAIVAVLVVAAGAVLRAPSAFADSGIQSATFQQTFGTVNTSVTAVNAPGELTGDFTGSGQTTLIVYGTPYGSTAPTLIIQAFVPNGSGGYNALAPQTLNFTSVPNIGEGNCSPVVMDVNGDGKLDILYGISAAYGNGDGTFQAPVTLPFLASGFIGTWAADLTGDGRMDIVALDTIGPVPAAPSTQPVTLQITVFENQGGGTFTSLGTFPVAQSPAESLASASLMSLVFGDLTDDGKPDIVAQSSFPPFGNAAGTTEITVVLNNGDGTFAAPQSVSVPAADLNSSTDAALPIALADFNGDGKTDLALGYNDQTGRVNLYVALGNGDGTFAAGQSFDLDATPSVPLAQIGSLVAIDINEDGKLDLATGDGLWAQGNGDGTFEAPSAPLFPLVVNSEDTGEAFPVAPFVFPGSTAPGLVYLNLGANEPAVFTAGNQGIDLSPGTGGSTALTVNSGSSVSTPINVSGGDGFSGTVTFACSGLPASASCTFSPQSVAVSGSTAASTTMTVITQSASGQNMGRLLPLGIGGGGSLALAFLIFVPVRRRRTCMHWMCVGFLALAVAMGFVGCTTASSGGTGGTGTPAGTYNFTVTATSETTQGTAAYTLTVN
jgi:hypothetical protein